MGGVFQDKPKGQLKYYREEHPCSFEAQYDHFKRIFLKKTGVNWDARLVKPYVDDGFHFRYTPPVSSLPDHCSSCFASFLVLTWPRWEASL